jgi:hypothetical protein
MGVSAAARACVRAGFDAADCGRCGTMPRISFLFMALAIGCVGMLQLLLLLQCLCMQHRLHPLHSYKVSVLHQHLFLCEYA